MPTSKHSIERSGQVTFQFGHRFVLKTEQSHVLADLGPHGALEVPLSVGDTVTLAGDQKPSEIKVRSIQVNDGPRIELEAPPAPKHGPKHGPKRDPEHGPKHGPEHGHESDAIADPAAALDAARAAGYETLAQPRRKPRHFEILGQRDDGLPKELHVEFDGHIRKERTADPADPKWQRPAP